MCVCIRIIAGPGSGKTRVLTSRVEYLIREKGCKPWELVVITFSNKAARELQDRLAVLLGQTVASRVIAGQIPLLVQQHPVYAEVKQIIIVLHRFHTEVLRMPELLLGHASSLAKPKAQLQLPCAELMYCSAGTFHSIGCQIVRRHVEHLGDTGRQGFNIFDQDDTKAVMKKALKQHFRQRRGTIASSNIEDDDCLEDAVAEQTQLQEWVSLAIVLFVCTSVAHLSTNVHCQSYHAGMLVCHAIFATPVSCGVQHILSSAELCKT